MTLHALRHSFATHLLERGTDIRIALFLDCRVSGWATWSALAIECGAASIALDIHLEDGGVMDEAIDGGEGHGWVWEDPRQKPGR